LEIARFSPGICSDVNAEHAVASLLVCAEAIAAHSTSRQAMGAVLVGGGKCINNSSTACEPPIVEF
jgi:hypothetical protein